MLFQRTGDNRGDRKRVRGDGHREKRGDGGGRGAAEGDVFLFIFSLSLSPLCVDVCMHVCTLLQRCAGRLGNTPLPFEEHNMLSYPLLKKTEDGF